MSTVLTDRNGRRVATLFRHYRSLPPDCRCCDLDGILREDEIDLTTSDHANPGYTACLLRIEDGPAGIILAPGQSRGRRRFSIAHELGHYHIPTHRKFVVCGEDDMREGAGSANTGEWEANDFAAELLMPRRLFAQDARDRDPVIASVLALASEAMYDVSVTAAALRYVEVTKESVALVSVANGRIEWVSQSDSFFYRIPWKGDAAPPGSVASFVLRGEPGSETGETIDPYVWLEVRQPGSLELIESTLSIPSQRQVLSLVWVVPE